MESRTGFAVMVALVLASLATAARAEPTAEDKALATALFKEARVMLESGPSEEACRKFAESQRLDPSGGTLLNLAHCHELTGRSASAWTEFNEAAAAARRDGRQDRLDFATNHMQSLEPNLSFVVVVVPPSHEVQGLQVIRNGRAVGRPAWGTRMPVDPGEHSVEASAPGRKPWSTVVTITAPRELKTVTIPLLEPEQVSPPSAGAARPAATPPAATTDATRDTSPASPGGNRVPAYVAGGVGIIGVGVGSYFGLRAFSKRSASDDECPGDRCSERGVELNDEARTSADISTVSFALGLTALGVGATLWLMGDGDEGSGAAAGVSPVAGSQHAGVQWVQRF